MKETSRNISEVIRSLNVLGGRGRKVCGEEKWKVGLPCLLREEGSGRRDGTGGVVHVSKRGCS